MPTTVGKLIATLLDEDPSGHSWCDPPPSPADVFAVCASLLKRSGAYQHILADPGVSAKGFFLKITAKDREEINAAAERWRSSRLPASVIKWWRELRGANESAVCDGEALLGSARSTKAAKSFPAWWKPAALLMMTGDSACDGVGFSEPDAALPYLKLFHQVLSLKGKAAVESISRVSTELHCVLPKCRAPTVGVTLRSLSHNLGLLPPRGVAKAQWIARGADIKDDGPLNLLLVPFPYRIDATSFKPTQKDKEGRWGSFHLTQDWLGKRTGEMTQFVAFVEELIDVARRQVGTVDAVIFPELALDAAYFHALSQALQGSTELEFLVSGLSEHPHRARHGNYVATAYFYNETAKSESDEQADTRSIRRRIVRVRAKHHRWKLDGRQLGRYGLGATLDPSMSWWEDFDIEPREVHVARFRSNSTVATLICEDLARIDPCQELIRTIGPSLVLVLLMDGPQLKPRWPARYATVLADDPGSSVLTFTSLGLINRQRDNQRNVGESCPATIALWKDNSGDAVEITLPGSHHAMALTLNPHQETAATMDGRTRRSSTWRLGGIHPIRLPRENRYEWVLHGR